MLEPLAGFRFRGLGFISVASKSKQPTVEVLCILKVRSQNGETST